MDQIILFIVLGAVIIGFGIVIMILNQRLREMQSAGALEMMKADVTELSRTIGLLQQNMGDKLERSNTVVQTSVQKQLTESAKLITDVTQRLTKLDETNKRVVDVADELKTLQNVLQNPKQRGVLGEFYLAQVLENVMPPDRFSLQYKFKNGEIVDAVIYLDKGKVLPVDSKFSLENYSRLIDEKDKPRREVLTKALYADLKGRIDETSKYIRPDENTMDFAFMFIPSEAIYYDLLMGRIG